MVRQNIEQIGELVTVEALVVADIVALLWLVTNPRLRACFTQESD